MVAERDEVVVGRLDTGTYVVLPVDGAELLRRLMDGDTPEAAAAWYRTAYGEPVDIAEFVTSLRELGFLRISVEDSPHDAPAPPRAGGPGRALLSPVAWACYAAIGLGWTAAVAGHQDLRPSPHQVFFTGSLVAVQLVLILAQIPLILLHEGFHVMAGRRLGLPSTIAVSNRLIDLVVETRMNGLFSVPRRRRYVPLLAGMLCDAVLCCALGLVAEATRSPDGTLPLAGRAALALAFTCVVRLAWQFQLYLRTDLYYVFATAVNCHDLHDAAVVQLRNRMWRLLGRRHRIVDVSEWTDRDLRIGRWYGPFVGLGIGTLLAVTVFASVPILVQYVQILVDRLSAARIDDRFWDCVVSLMLNAANGVALVLVARRKHRGRRASR
jgi:hypothetical protein